MPLKDPAARAAYHKEYMKRWYAKPENAAAHKRRTAKVNTEQRRKVREFVKAAKDAPCADCGQRFPYVCMDFDHLDPGTKVMEVSRMTNLPIEQVKAEIAKCELVCANCHRIRTATRGSQVRSKAAGS